MKAMGGGEKLTLVLAEHLSLRHNVFLFSEDDLDVPSLEQFFGVDLSRVSFSRLNGPGLVSKIIARVCGRNRRTFTPHHFLQLKNLNLDLFINISYASTLPSPSERGIFLCMFPHQTSHRNKIKFRTAAADWFEKRMNGSAVSKSLDSYPLIIAISRYSADWVRRFWGRNSEIVYPPCDDMGPLAAKRKMILHVGRFISDGADGRHHKNQRFLIETFKRLTDLHSAGWELHLVGSVTPDDRSTSFTETLIEAGRGFPVFFHFNAPREEMRTLYQTAAIYWHATGYGSDVEQHPAKQEHFGMSTVEAMSAGAVPVVYSSGGQKEIVTDGVNGFLWNDVEELMSRTRDLANDQVLLCELSSRAVNSSKQFGRTAFAARIDELMSGLNVEPRSEVS
jgi:glycosyltransferase involved in cell wall biosynthesis